MKNLKTVCILCCLLVPVTLLAEPVTVTGPDGRLAVTLDVSEQGVPTYTVRYDNIVFLEPSPLGFRANIGDYTQGMQYVSHEQRAIDTTYTMTRIKQSTVHYTANELTFTLENARRMPLQIVFRVSDNDIAFRYVIPKRGETGSIRIMEETSGFRFPASTTTFLCPQSDAMIGWKRSKPSYEEEYTLDAPMDRPSQYGHGYTFPCLFRLGEAGWVLLGESDVDSHYCGSHLSDYHDGGYTIALAMPEENNGNGTAEPAFALPGATPWRTLTIGRTLAPIVETTVTWDVAEPRYATRHDYRFGRSTWSWILWQDNSINYDDLVQYIDLAAAMGYEYTLIDAAWDRNIGYRRMEDLIRYAQSKHVDVFLWYSSSGYWNDITQSPVNKMDNAIVRKQEMRWMESLGVKGIKVDFFGGDKQETFRLYEEILSDADDHGLMVIFHGCTLPRGWERMYPNYVGSEAVLASENIYFQQHFCDEEAVNAATHPVIRNALGCMEFGGTFLNRRLNRDNRRGNIRRTTDVFELATAVLFQNPIQNFALAPNNLTDAPAVCIDFMKDIPTTWDEVRFIDGYPGRYVVLARRHGDTWYVAAINATKEPLTIKADFPEFAQQDVTLYSDAEDLEPLRSTVKIKKKGTIQATIPSQGAAIWIK
ncbi:MAG: glycoside hydrolase family 97 catalytic domain-containing protein [Bacteroidales bacterium]|nr:glycoside hydrolase family 97 catalytic domain-containing protein [Bacteroidales bacterium]